MKIFRLLPLVCSLFLFWMPVFAEAGTLVRMTTSLGVIDIELNDEKSPITARNFLNYIDEKYYDNTLFHRVIDGFMIQGGGFDTKFKRKRSHASIQNESNNHLSNVRGTVAMARRQDPDSAASQFFINQANNTNLDYPHFGGYTVFGRVVKGMGIVDKIARVATSTRHFMQNVPTQDVVLLQVRRLKP